MANNGEASGEITHISQSVRLQTRRDVEDTQLVTHVSLGHADEGFYLFFGRTVLPSGWDKDVTDLETVDIDIVAKLFLAPATMLFLANLLNENPMVRRLIELAEEQSSRRGNDQEDA